MDVDKDILLAQCLRNSVRLFYRFESVYVSTEVKGHEVQNC